MNSREDVLTPKPKNHYETEAYMGKGGNLSMSSPGGSLNRRSLTGAGFQKARRKRK